jgi:hypothetical protein
MHPSVSRELMKTRQQDGLRAAANRRLAAEAKQARDTAHPARPASGTTRPASTVPTIRPARVPQLRKLLGRLLPA